MKLSELQPGGRAVVVKVKGHGGFRKRIVKAGFAKGQLVEALTGLAADATSTYLVAGSEVSLRLAEADKIMVISEDEAHVMEHDENLFSRHEIVEAHKHDHQPLTEWQIKTVAMKKRHVISVALVGSPDSGKSSLLAHASAVSERAADCQDKTVAIGEGIIEFEGYTLHIVDLPATHSLSSASAEELYVRRHVVETIPDVVVNVVDTCHLEQGLHLTTQFIDMHLRMVCALNMFDKAMARGDRLDHERLGRLIGVPMVPTELHDGKGIDRLLRTVVDIYESNEGERSNYRHIHIFHGHEVEDGITHIQKYLKTARDVCDAFSTRFLAIKLLEGDADVEAFVGTLPNSRQILLERDKTRRRVREEIKGDVKSAVMDAKSGFIHGALKEAGHMPAAGWAGTSMVHRLDSLITNRWLGIPLFVVVMWAVFEATFTLGQTPMDWISDAVAWIDRLLRAVLPDGMFRDMLTDGIIGGVGAVAVSLPQILLLYMFIAIMDDSGYMARAAFIMDNVMHRMGLHGKSFIPMVMGFGCNVPAIMACRTIESRRSRLVTMLILPFMSCSARLPVYVVITGIFFAPQHRSAVLIGIYLVGVLLAVLSSRVLCRYVVKGDDTPFVMELPPFRLPTMRAIARHTCEKGAQYLKKMGGVILVASIVVWALGYFPHDPSLTARQQKEASCIAQMGRAVQPIFAPLGFNWQLGMCLMSGVGAKEIVASTLGVLYSDDGDTTCDATDVGDRYDSMRTRMERDGITPATAIAFMLFVLIYFPCVASLSAIKSETGSWRWTVFAAGYTTMLAWAVAAAATFIYYLLFP